MSDRPWVDAFLFWDTAAVAALMLVDWLLGEQKRDTIRKKVGDWWVYVQESDFTGLIQQSALKARTLLTRMFGDYWFSRRFITSSFAASFCLSLTLTIAIYGQLFGKAAFSDAFGKILWLGFVLMGAVTAFSNWLSVALAVYLLRVMENKTSQWILALTIADLAGASLISATALTLIFALASVVFFVQPFGAALLFLPFLVIIAFTNLLPTAFHLFMVVLFVGSKVLQPLMRPTLSVILARLYESKQGVLSLLGISLGTMAKLVQTSIKYFG